MATQIAPCECTVSHVIIVKQAGAKTELCPKWEQPWFTRENGAQFQDARYGKGMRLHNVRVKGKRIGLTCTCCGKQKTD